jgi:hypothetical protein
VTFGCSSPGQLGQEVEGMATALAGGDDDDFESAGDPDAHWRQQRPRGHSSVPAQPEAFFGPEAASGDDVTLWNLARAARYLGDPEVAAQLIGPSTRHPGSSGLATVTPIHREADRPPSALGHPPSSLLEYFSRLAPTKEAFRHVLVSVGLALGLVLALLLAPLVLAAAVVGGSTVLGWLGAALGGTVTIVGGIVTVRRVVARRGAQDQNDADSTDPA